MSVDASALAAVIPGEPDARVIADRLDRASEPITSPTAVYEAVLAVARQRGGGASVARAAAKALLGLAGIRIVPVEAEGAAIARAAFERFGKGRGRPAQPDTGECFAYACARRHRVPLLFEGDDFSRTDVEARRGSGSPDGDPGAQTGGAAS